MKRNLFIYGLLILSNTVTAQETFAPTERPALNDIPTDKLKSIGVSSVNHFQLAVAMMEECPCSILNGTLELFSPNAFIEVKNIGGMVKRYSPQSYFRTINALKCGKDRRYRDMKFEYQPVSEADAIVTRLNGTCTVSYTITQTFIGWASGDNSTYSDRTRKVITINFLADGNEIEPKIIAITVQNTENVQLHVSTINHR